MEVNPEPSMWGQDDSAVMNRLSVDAVENNLVADMNKNSS